MKKIFSTRVTENALAVALLILRVSAGSQMMIKHGLDKLNNFADKSSQFADPFGIGAMPSFALTIFAEFFCAALIVLGLFTRFATLPLIVAMSIALFYAHGGDFYGQGELAGLFLTIFVTLLITGPGKISLDRFISK